MASSLFWDLCYAPPKPKASQENDRCYKQANPNGQAAEKSAASKNKQRRQDGHQQIQLSTKTHFSLLGFIETFYR
jgi:hypothetical protein